jgi:hypothetical protein
MRSETGRAVTNAISEQGVKLRALFPQLRGLQVYGTEHGTVSERVSTKPKHHLLLGGSSENVLGKVSVSSLILQNALRPRSFPSQSKQLYRAEPYLEKLTVALLRKKSPAHMQPRGSVARSQESVHVPTFVGT